MLIRDHLNKARLFEQAIAKLDPAVDSRIFAWLIEKAATQRANAILHAWRLTREHPEGAADLAEIKPGLSGDWKDAERYHLMAERGDLIHARYAPAGTEFTAEAVDLLDKVEFFERERQRFVREEARMDPLTIETWQSVYASICAHSPKSGSTPYE